MTDCVEIAITSDTAAQHWSCCVWDVRTGTQLMSYRNGGPPASNCLHNINNQYILAGNLTKPMLTMWPINRQEPASVKYMLPSAPGAMAVSPDGNYCVVSHTHVFNVYNLATGANMASVAHHFGKIAVVKFTDDSSHFVTAADDCRVVVWSLGRTVQQKENKMLYEFADCTLPVSDLFVGKSGMKAIVAVSSLDRSCKLYELATGRMLLNVVFPVALSTLTLNALETELFVGDKKGLIYTCNLQSAPRSKEVHLQQDQLKKGVFNGHKKAVNCLSMSMDNETLLSGGADEVVIVWHVKTRQQLKVLPHKGPITNAFFLITPKPMFDPSRVINVPFPPFQKVTISRQDREKLSMEFSVTKQALEESSNIHVTSHTASVVSAGDKEKNVQALELEIQKLKSINQRLYQQSLKIILKDSEIISDKISDKL